MTTCIIQIGNSDDGLKQVEWSKFCHSTEETIKDFASHIHFGGFARADAPWQNACWVAEVEQTKIRRLEIGLAIVAGQFRQESITFTVGVTTFISPRRS